MEIPYICIKASKQIVFNSH